MQLFKIWKSFPLTSFPMNTLWFARYCYQLSHLWMAIHTQCVNIW